MRALAVDGKYGQLVVRSAVVIGLCGLPGSGKSTLAQALQEHTGWARLDRDAMRAELFSSGGYSNADKAMLNLAMRDSMNTCLANMQSVILDGMTLSAARTRHAFRSDAQAAGADWLLVWLDCPVATAQERVAVDGKHAARDRPPALVTSVAQRFETPRKALRLDARESAPELLLRILPALTPYLDPDFSK